MSDLMKKEEFFDSKVYFYHLLAEWEGNLDDSRHPVNISSALRLLAKMEDVVQEQLNAVDQNIYHIEYSYNLGVVYQALGMDDKAIDMYQTAIETSSINSFKVMAYVSLASLYLKTGKNRFAGSKLIQEGQRFIQHVLENEDSVIQPDEARDLEDQLNHLELLYQQ